ncbi:hypothetical protein CLV31_1205 [Algoriphagus aquaeductus]|jgi:hypothetical protein|uniref:Uncharacterized protein n=1 Tax=Algoriphagus aquaeductus TaxID=475299 RepID=A0A326RJC8_9BACT|nr:hypothetical protein CLV31_1205 [Algoriphagus aquaeductus]
MGNFEFGIPFERKIGKYTPEFEKRDFLDSVLKIE